MQSVPSTELLSSLLIYKNSSSLLSWAKIISDSGAALSPNQLKYFLSRYNATMHANCLFELLPILSDLSNRYLEPGMPRIPKSVSLNMEQEMISLPLSMTFLTNIVISLLKQLRERDALQLLQCIHPLQWPYDEILSYLASNNKILDVLAVLQKFEELNNNNYMSLKESTARIILSLPINDVPISIDDLNSYKDRSRFFHITIEVDKSLVSKIRETVARIMTNKIKDESNATNNKKYEMSTIEMKEFNSDYDYISPSKRLGMLPSYSKGASDLDTILSLLPEDIDVLNDNNDESAIVNNITDDNIQENLMFLLSDKKNQRLQFDSSLFEKTTITDDTMANFDDMLLKNKNSMGHEKPITSKWIDPESPENVMKFIVDIESLGRQKDEFFKKVEIKDSPLASGNIHVAAQKKYWKNHLRNNMRISNAEANQLDVEDIISDHYRLEISSPGLPRPLFYPWQFQENIGKMAKIKLIRLIEGQRWINGLIKSVNNETVDVEELCGQRISVIKAN
jgi:ribosome maturation factor RimP